MDHQILTGTAKSPKDRQSERTHGLDSRALLYQHVRVCEFVSFCGGDSTAEDQVVGFIMH